MCGGHFWVLAEASSDEDDDRDSPCSDPTRQLRYISNSNSSNSNLSSARRLKRDQKRLSPAEVGGNGDGRLTLVGERTVPAIGEGGSLLVEKKTACS
jgi:hypothetical protein